MSTLVFVEDPADEISRQAVTFAGQLGDDVSPVAFAGDRAYAPAAWARALAAQARERGSRAVLAPGTDRGNEVLAHVAAVLDQPLAANCTAITPGDPATVTRVRWGGSLLEEARLQGSPMLMTVAPHAVAADPAAVNGNIEIVPTRTIRSASSSASAPPRRGSRWPTPRSWCPAGAGSGRRKGSRRSRSWPSFCTGPWVAVAL